MLQNWFPKDFPVQFNSIKRRWGIYYFIKRSVILFSIIYFPDVTCECGGFWEILEIHWLKKYSEWYVNAVYRLLRECASGNVSKFKNNWTILNVYRFLTTLHLLAQGRYQKFCGSQNFFKCLKQVTSVIVKLYYTLSDNRTTKYSKPRIYEERCVKRWKKRWIF